MIFKILGDFQIILVFKFEGFFEQMSSVNLRAAFKF